MNIAFYEIKGQNILSINFVIPIGTKTIYDGKVNKFAHLVEHLLFHGHPEYSQYELMLKLEEMGAIVNAETNDFYTELYARIQKKYLKNVVKILSEAILIFDIRKQDYLREKEIIRIEEYDWNKTGMSLIGNIVDSCFESIKKDRSPSFFNLKSIYEALYNNWSLVIIGDVSPENKDEIYSLFKSNNKKEINFPKNILTTKMINKKFYFNNKVDGKQVFTYVHECTKTTGIIEMKLICNIYAVGLSSVLYDYLVAENNYCYSINFKDYVVDNKFFAIYFTYENIKFNELKSYFDNIFTEDFVRNLPMKEIERAINMVITHTLLKRENTSSIMNDIIENYIFNQDITINQDVFEEVKRLSVEDARSIVIKALFQSEGV